MVALVDQNRSSFCCCVGCGVLNPESSFYWRFRANWKVCTYQHDWAKNLPWHASIAWADQFCLQKKPSQSA
jgi:hypothetical protein